MAKYEYKNIVGTFRYGIKSKALYVLYSVAFSICILAAVFLLVVAFAVVGGNSAETNSALILVAGIFSAVGIIGFLILLIYFFSVKKRISLWLNDENIVEKRVIPWVHTSRCFNIYGMRSYKIGVLVVNNDSQQIIISKKYDLKFNKFTDKEITILYSPKFNEVIILK